MPLTCALCPVEKILTHPQKRVRRQQNAPEHTVWTDTIGTIYTTPINGMWHMLKFIDLISRYVFAVPITSRAQIHMEVENILIDISDKLNTNVLRAHSDNGKKLVPHNMRITLRKRGLLYASMAPYHPQENSIVQRFNKTVMTAVHGALAHSDLIHRYWTFLSRNACKIGQLQNACVDHEQLVTHAMTDCKDFYKVTTYSSQKLNRVYKSSYITKNEFW